MTTGRINQVAIGQTLLNVRHKAPLAREPSSHGRDMTSELRSKQPKLRTELPTLR